MSPPEGLLVVDKPEGPTSHDVVARVRRAIGEKRIGHTGTLDPSASGVLSLVVGRATRLAQFMAGDVKEYTACVQLGVDTDTYDAQGKATGPSFDGAWPSAEDVLAAVTAFRGTFLQTPPAYSAKKIGGRRAYDLARRGSRPDSSEPTPRLEPVSVTLAALVVSGYDQGAIHLHLTCSAGFYVRSLAHDIGERLGTGAHLATLRRTRSGSATIDDAWPLAKIEADPAEARARVVPMAGMLPNLSAVVVSETGLRKVAHGQALGPGDFRRLAPVDPASPLVETSLRLLSPTGDLIGIAKSTRATDHLSVLHPSVVLM